MLPDFSPQPIITAYIVRRLKYAMLGDKVVAEWASAKAQIVNTVDIQNVLREENTFLLGWQTTYYTKEQGQVKGQIITRDVEKTLEYDHPVNPSIILAIFNKVKEAHTQSGIVPIPKYRSFEKILLDLKAAVVLDPLANPEDIKAMYALSDEVLLKLQDQEELKVFYSPELLAKLQNDVTTDSYQDEPPLEEVERDTDNTVIEQRVASLETGLGEVQLGISQILSILGNRQANEEPNSTGAM